MKGSVLSLVLLLFMGSSAFGSDQFVRLPERLDDAIALMRAQAPQALPEPLQDIASGWVIVPTAANVPGNYGAYFKTHVSVLAVAEFASSPSVAIDVILLPNSGGYRTTRITLSNGETRTWQNVLNDLFAFSGAGAVIFDTVDLDDHLVVTADVYTESPAGRFSTAVETLTILGYIGSTYPDLTVGVTVDSTTRANIGCSSYSSSPGTALATFYGPDGYKTADATLSIPARGWVQVPVQFQISGGAIIWQATRSYTFCWAVNVHNQSNDGTFLGRTTFVQ